MNERASERASVSVNEAGPCSRRQAIPWFQRPQPMSGRPDDSFNKSLLNSGRFHFNQRRDLSSNGSVGKKKKSQPDYKDVGRKETAVMMRGKTSFSKEIQDPLDRYECEQDCPLGGELCPKTFIQPFIYIKSNHECAILFSIYYECTVNAHSIPRLLALDPFCERNIKQACTS